MNIFCSAGAGEGIKFSQLGVRSRNYKREMRVRMQVRSIFRTAGIGMEEGCVLLTTKLRSLVQLWDFVTTTFNANLGTRSPKKVISFDFNVVSKCFFG